MPAGNKLTNLAVRSAKVASGQQRLLSDGNRLYLRVRNRSEAVEKDWVFLYTPRPGTPQRKLGLGPYPTVTLERARQKADEARKLLADGIDPQTERRLRRAVATSAEALPQTVEELFERWHTLALCQRKDGGAEVRRAFSKDVFPSIGPVLLKDVRRGHVTSMLDQVIRRGARRLANRLLSDLRQMFKFAVVRDFIASDPTYGITKQNVGGRETERDRVLTEEEIRLLTRMLPAAKLSRPTELSVWIMLATCCRVGELIKARWADIDMEKGTWTIPADNAKNSRAHTIHLSSFAKKQFEVLRSVGTSDEWVYPGRPDDSGTETIESRPTHIYLKSITKQLRDRQRSAKLAKRSAAVNSLNLPGGDWVPHDLRRTGATLMASLGVMPAVIERCLNHVEQNRMARIYQRHDFSAEQREAWRLLGERLDALTTARAATM